MTQNEEKSDEVETEETVKIIPRGKAAEKDDSLEGTQIRIRPGRKLKVNNTFFEEKTRTFLVRKNVCRV